MMKHSSALRKRIEDSRIELDGKNVFKLEIERANNVLLKLARGHAAYELNRSYRAKPNHFWCSPLSELSPESREIFNSVHFQEMIGEDESRSMQRLFLMQMTCQMENGQHQNTNLLINDWVDVQGHLYRYIAIEDMGLLIIRIVIAEYFAWEL
jgi:hypothetical protein